MNTFFATSIAIILIAAITIIAAIIVSLLPAWLVNGLAAFGLINVAGLIIRLLRNRHAKVQNRSVAKVQSGSQMIH